MELHSGPVQPTLQYSHLEPEPDVSFPFWIMFGAGYAFGLFILFVIHPLPDSIAIGIVAAPVVGVLGWLARFISRWADTITAALFVGVFGPTLAFYTLALVRSFV